MCNFCWLQSSRQLAELDLSPSWSIYHQENKQLLIWGPQYWSPAYFPSVKIRFRRQSWGCYSAMTMNYNPMNNMGLSHTWKKRRTQNRTCCMIPSSTKRGKTKLMSEVRRVATLRWGYTADRIFWGYSSGLLRMLWFLSCYRWHRCVYFLKSHDCSVLWVLYFLNAIIRLKVCLKNYLTDP